METALISFCPLGAYVAHTVGAHDANCKSGSLGPINTDRWHTSWSFTCLLYTSDAADDPRVV